MLENLCLTVGDNLIQSPALLEYSIGAFGDSMMLPFPEAASG